MCSVGWLRVRFWTLAVAIAGCWATGSALAQAATTVTTLKVATWNLGWHLSQAESAQWAQLCGQSFVRDPRDRLWKPSPAGTQTGWQLTWGRDAPIEWPIGTWPPCDVYQDRSKPVAVTPQSSAQRQRQIRELLAERVQADVIAFQEVSGEAAVREVLPDQAQGWEVCSYRGYKVQRLAIAWRRSVGVAVSCEVHAPLSLPALHPGQQPRPGLALTLRVNTPQGERSLRILTLHLKSSCVSPIEAPTERQPARGRLDGDDEHCQLLQQQVAPLEAWLEQASAGVDGWLVLGDFNRNLGHEVRAAAAQPVRSSGRATDPHRPGVRVRNLWLEVNDQEPARSGLQLLEAACRGEGPEGDALASTCSAARQRALTEVELKTLRQARGGLGCRNPIGLDHIALGGALQAAPGANGEPAAQKIPIGLYGRTRAANTEHPQPLLAVSDHCPLVATIRWQGAR
jgi:endonuclease/exonuclease/phosphatase family metal-dependent hydrolase